MLTREMVPAIFQRLVEILRFASTPDFAPSGRLSIVTIDFVALKKPSKGETAEKWINLHNLRISSVGVFEAKYDTCGKSLDHRSLNPAGHPKSAKLPPAPPLDIYDAHAFSEIPDMLSWAPGALLE